MAAIEKAHLTPLLSQMINDNVLEEIYTDEVLNTFEEYLPALQRVFAVFARTNNWNDVLDRNTTLSTNDTLAFATAFELINDNLPKATVRKVCVNEIRMMYSHY